MNNWPVNCRPKKKRSGSDLGSRVSGQAVGNYRNEIGSSSDPVTPLETAGVAAERFFDIVGGVLGDLSGIRVSPTGETHGANTPRTNRSGATPVVAVPTVDNVIDFVQGVGRALDHARPLLQESVAQLAHALHDDGPDNRGLRLPFAQRGLGSTMLDANSAVVTYEISEACSSTAGTQCMVCLEAFRPGEELRYLPCLHCFHRAFIDPWLMRHCECPICKNRVGR